MKLIRENGKMRVFESNGYTITIWDGGSIVMKKDDDIIKVDHNAKNMKKMKQMLDALERKEKGIPENESFFITPNVVANDILSEVKHFSYDFIDGKIVLDTRSKDQNVSRSGKTNQMKFPMPRKNSNVKFERNTRYEIAEIDGPFVYLEEREPITLRNIFQNYAEPLINVY